MALLKHQQCKTSELIEKYVDTKVASNKKVGEKGLSVAMAKRARANQHRNNKR